MQRPDARRCGGASGRDACRTVNVNFASGASRGRYFQIRGIGETGQFAEPLNASVGIVLDGVDLSGAAGAATTYDLEQVEIFRGPQGTCCTAPTLAGLINLVSAAIDGDAVPASRTWMPPTTRPRRRWSPLRAGIAGELRVPSGGAQPS
ncbi:MAG: TonB-dependent receptor plug domain-containing protein [Pseudomonadales bacterium]